MEKTIHRSGNRGYTDRGWSESRHTFSFSDYYDPERIHFGALRALNEDTVKGGQGFGIHPHDNMEIITIPLDGTLVHTDSIGSGRRVLQPGDVQIMSAGTGILHSEFNGSPSQPLSFLEIWIFPDRQDLTPRYKDVKLPESIPDELQLIAAPAGSGNAQAGWIHQQAWLYRALLDPDSAIKYRLHNAESGVYIFVISGAVKVGEESLAARDGVGLIGTQSIGITGERRSRILLIEVPMKW